MKSLSLMLTNIFKNSSMKRKLVSSYFVFIFFPLLIVGVFAYNISEASIKNEVSKYVSELLQQVNSNIDLSLTELDRMTVSIISDPGVQKILQKDKSRPVLEALSDDEFVSGRISAVSSLQPYIEGLYIFSYNGEVYMYKGSHNSMRPDYIFTSAKWFKTMKSLKQKILLLPTHLQDGIIVEGKPKKVFSYIREISDTTTGKSIGYILVDVNSDIFRNILDNLDITNYHEIFIVNNNKTIIYDSNTEYISMQFRSPYISRLLVEKTGSIMENVDGSPMLVTFNTSSDTQWTVASVIPESVLFKNISTLKYFIILTIIFCLTLAFILAVLLSGNITRPISRLRAHMKKAESGNFDISVPVESKDEVGELSSSFNQMLLQIRQLISKVYKADILKKEAELNALQAQINPHFLYNTLQIMDVIAEAEGIEVISATCQSLSDIFRYSINRGKEVVRISDEIAHVQNYVYIQKLRFEEKFKVVYDIDEEVTDYQIVKLILQPIVENVLVHGMDYKKSCCTIKIRGKKLDNVIILTVEDDGTGMDTPQLEALRASLSEEIVHAEVVGSGKNSIGIKNVNARIKLYYGEQFGLSIESGKGRGTSVKVTIPAIFYNYGDDSSAKISDR